MKKDILLKLAVLSCAVSLLTACESLGVKPWERDILARDDMALDSAPMDTAFDEHIYFSKEASSGGQGFGGGGCGCN